MTPKEVDMGDLIDGAMALMRWFQSQDVDPQNAVCIMAIAIASTLSGMSTLDGVPGSLKKRQRLVARMIADAIENMRHEEGE